MNKILIGFFAIFFIAVFIFGTQWLDIINYKFFAPKIQEAKREVWEETPSRILGANQQITQSRLEFIRTDNIHEKRAICDMLIDSYPDITSDEIESYNSRQFYLNCQNGIYQ